MPDLDPNDVNLLMNRIESIMADQVLDESAVAKGAARMRGDQTKGQTQ